MPLLPRRRRLRSKCKYLYPLTESLGVCTRAALIPVLGRAKQVVFLVNIDEALTSCLKIDLDSGWRVSDMVLGIDG